MPQANVNGVRLYYKTQGQGEALVMIPGMGSGHESWFRQLPAFKKHFKVITFDPRGIGRSERPQQPYGFKALADDVVGLMDYLGVRKAHILGQSLGGLVAQEVAIDYPERVLRLVLVSSTVAGDNVNPTNPELMEALGYAEGATEVDFSKLDTRKTMNTVIGMSFDKPLYRKAMQFLSRFFVKPEMFDGLSDQLRAIAGHNTIDRLHLIQARTLVITGAEDRIVFPQASESLAARIAGAKLVMVQGGSHGFNVEMTPRFNREVLEFLRAA
ncbi:MAG: alpha/beta fold hydrolase [Dehalococcoidia bacterium]|nr:alpha/beta fold hydrolase [Dehalococcoidia bacterium]